MGFKEILSPFIPTNFDLYIIFNLIIPGHIIFNYILPKYLIFNNTSL